MKQIRLFVAASAQSLTQRVGKPQEFALAHMGTKQQRLLYLSHAWERINHQFFHDQLAVPEFKLLRDAGAHLKLLGLWNPNVRTISIAPRAFVSTEDVALVALTHEMCHQAVTEINGIEEGNAGHGPIWSEYMRKCGLQPDRIGRFVEGQFMTEAEKQKMQPRTPRDAHLFGGYSASPVSFSRI